MNSKNVVLANMLWNERAITVKDCNRLMNQITDDVGMDHVSPKGLHALYLLTVQSKKFGSNDISPEVVTLNSDIILSAEGKQKQLVRIVLPESVERKHDVSNYSPAGIACLGAKEGDYVSFKKENDWQQFRIEKIIFQPEK